MKTHPTELVRPRRKITGISAILLPFAAPVAVDWLAFTEHVQRTADAGLIPAVNMDTGYVNLLEVATRKRVLEKTAETLQGRRFVAGAFVKDNAQASFNEDAYRREIDAIQERGGIPVIFQSFGLVEQSDEQIVDSYRRIAAHCDQFIAFELGSVFAPFGSIYSLEVYEQLVQIQQCIGAKHSSLRRDLEWQRLEIRDNLRSEFMVLTGNDLAIDMIVYGSDYLLGLSTFAPDLFARRDALWEAGDAEFYQLNDILQYLGFLAFRRPVPAYKHNAAMFLHQRGLISTDLTHTDSPKRPPSDRAILREIGHQLGLEMQA